MTSGGIDSKDVVVRYASATAYPLPGLPPTTRFRFFFVSGTVMVAGVAPPITGARPDNPSFGLAGTAACARSGLEFNQRAAPASRLKTRIFIISSILNYCFGTAV